MKVDFDSELQLVIVDGLPINLEVLKHLANPDSTKLYRFKRDGDSCVCEVIDSGTRQRCQSSFDLGSNLGSIHCMIDDSEHASSHVGSYLGQRIHWLDNGSQCEEGFTREGLIAEQVAR